MPRKVIIDCDPGIDDAVALCLALADPRIEVLAVTGVAGNVPARLANRNTQAVAELFDLPRQPRIGTASPLNSAPAVDGMHIHGDDGLGGAEVRVSQRHHEHPSEKVICDAVRAHPDQVTIIALGPLTNLARAFHLDPELPLVIGQILMMGGSVSGVGNVTPAAEFNMFYDPLAAQTVFRTPVTKTLIPLNVTNQVTFTFDFVDQLPPDSTRAGKLLRPAVTHLFRAYRSRLGLEGIHLHDAVALTAALYPELFHTEEMAGDVETVGELTTGATVFDRRPNRQWRPNMDVAVEVNAAGVLDVIVRGLQEAGRLTEIVS